MKFEKIGEPPIPPYYRSETIRKTDPGTGHPSGEKTFTISLAYPPGGPTIILHDHTRHDRTMMSFAIEDIPKLIDGLSQALEIDRQRQSEQEAVTAERS